MGFSVCWCVNAWISVMEDVNLVLPHSKHLSPFVGSTATLWDAQRPPALLTFKAFTPHVFVVKMKHCKNTWTQYIYATCRSMPWLQRIYYTGFRLK